MHSRVLALASLVLLALVAPAHAQEEAQKPDFAAAKRHFKAGQEFLQMDRYADAIVEFKKAYEITKDGLVMGQVAEAFAKAGDFEAALDALKVYRAALPEGERSAADELRKEYEKAVKEGRSKKLVLPSDQPKLQPKDDATPPPVKPEDKPRRKGRLWTWIAAGAAGALAISALAVGLNAQSKFDDLNNTCKPACPDSEVDSVHSRAVAADVMWGLAGAAAVTSVVLFFLEGRAASAGGEQKAPGEDGGGGDEETVSKRKIRFTPVVGVGTYGMGAQVRF
jgi:tetratricopeptide (TPR) repeat protein